MPANSQSWKAYLESAWRHADTESRKGLPAWRHFQRKRADHFARVIAETP
jgi:hypothetical protein